MSLMWMPAQTTRPPLRTAPSAAGTNAPTGANRMAVSKGSGGVSSEPPTQRRTERQRKFLRGAVARPGERVDVASLPPADLGDDVGGGAEAIQTDAAAVARQLERTPADQPGAQQRRRGDGIVETVERKGEALRRRSRGWRSRRRGV